MKQNLQYMENNSNIRSTYVRTISSYEEFVNDIMTKMETERPKEWRKGQFVFNYIEMVYGEVAREVQFVDRVDCFYRDDIIEDFTKCVWKRLTENQ